MPKSAKGAWVLVRNVGTQQSPALENVEGGVDLDRGCDDRTGVAHALLCVDLCGRQSTMCGLEFEPVKLTLVDEQKIGNAGDDAKRLEDRGFNRRAPTAGRVMKHEESGDAAPAQVLEHNTL